MNRKLVLIPLILLGGVACGQATEPVVSRLPAVVAPAVHSAPPTTSHAQYLEEVDAMLTRADEGLRNAPTGGMGSGLTEYERQQDYLDCLDLHSLTECEYLEP